MLPSSCKGLITLALLLCCTLLAGCGSGFRTFPPGTIISNAATTVSVYPFTNEDLVGPCVYDLRLPSSTSSGTAGTLVIFERGDSLQLYNDASLQATAAALNFAIVFAHECDAATTGSFQADASKGPARVLTAALSQLAISSAHTELATTKLTLFGFSAAGVLAATMSNTMPARLSGVVSYAPGDQYVDLNDVAVSGAAAQIPTLVLGNALDRKSGTARGEHYFERGLALGGKWAYGVQNATTHCCTLSTRALLSPWLVSVAGASNSVLTQPFATGVGVYGTFTCKPDSTTDAYGDADCAFSVAALQSTAPATGTYAWLPDRTTGDAWLTWVLNPVTN